MTATIAEHIAQQLADRILSGDLAPGQRIEEKTVTEQFGVSRTPVRDALRQLAATGLVAIRPHRGVTVVDLEVDQLSDMFEAQAEIEALCAQLSARRMSAIEQRKLQMVAEDSEGALPAADLARYSSANEKLHKLIYAGAHNDTLEQIAINLWNRVAPFRRSIFFKFGNRMEHSFGEHNAVVEAILAGDEARAREAMHAHITNSSVNAIDYLLQHGGDGDKPA
ncbi:GntR family transcriptional regulator [Parahaliea mediterranea]|uniref:GntR family transcriptional regulator n=1 Tax=Parahaliea mediterranea TaxID=651086 RepID=A0A939II60_9GAMM|nr:GntR family transcriptional regulator [Parahaliea mediterranea]MBN7796244.1 GntR family transcriptional regulator [Parahaliea mediterranea]